MTLAARKESTMKTLKRMVTVIVLLCVALCLTSARTPKEEASSVPPGINEADWHSITDDFGYILSITRIPFLQQNKSTPIPENKTDEEKRKIKEIRKKHRADLERLPENHVGQARAVFFARKGETWYTISAPPSPVVPQLIQQ
jgi:hypothetical protein